VLFPVTAPVTVATLPKVVAPLAPAAMATSVPVRAAKAGVAIFSKARASCLLRFLRSCLVDIVMGETGFVWIADSVRLRDEGNARVITAAAQIDAKQAAGAPLAFVLRQ